MRDELDDHPEDYRSLTYEYWCDLLSTIKVRYERKRAAVHINNIASASTDPLSDSDKSVRIPRRKKANTGVSNYHQSSRRAHYRHHGAHRYCVLCKKAGRHERKYASHITKDCTGVRTKRSIKDGMGGPIESRTHDVQQNKKSEKKWKKDLKALRNQNKMLYSISKKSGLRREINKIKNIRAEASKETYYSSEDWDYNSSLAINSI